jgi:hypothetical protein
VSLALPTVLLVAALVPGIAFVHAYYAGRFTREVAMLSPLGELALFFFWALVIDSIALWVLIGPFTPQSVSTFLDFAAGKPSDADLTWMISHVGSFGWLSFAWKYAAVVGLAGLAGGILRRIVWALRLDLYLPPLRMKSEWFYALQGRLPGVARLAVPQADVLVAHPGTEGTRLYAGIVSGFESTHDGELDRLILTVAQRYGTVGTRRMVLKPVPGDLLILEAKTILSINMRYTTRAEAGLDPGPTHGFPLFLANVESFLNSLIFEEP